MASIKIKRNDQVDVIAGKDKGKQGRVLRVLADKNRVLVEGVMMVKKHVKPNPQRNIKGGIAEQESPVHISNVSLVRWQNGKEATRIGSRMEDGKKTACCQDDWRSAHALQRPSSANVRGPNEGPHGAAATGTPHETVGSHPGTVEKAKKNMAARLKEKYSKRIEGGVPGRNSESRIRWPFPSSRRS